MAPYSGSPRTESFSVETNVEQIVESYKGKGGQAEERQGDRAEIAGGFRGVRLILAHVARA